MRWMMAPLALYQRITESDGGFRQVSWYPHVVKSTPNAQPTLHDPQQEDMSSGRAPEKNAKGLNSEMMLPGNIYVSCLR